MASSRRTRTLSLRRMLSRPVVRLISLLPVLSSRSVTSADDGVTSIAASPTFNSRLACPGRVTCTAIASRDRKRSEKPAGGRRTHVGGLQHDANRSPRAADEPHQAARRAARLEAVAEVGVKSDGRDLEARMTGPRCSRRRRRCRRRRGGRNGHRSERGQHQEQMRRASHRPHDLVSVGRRVNG